MVGPGDGRGAWLAGGEPPASDPDNTSVILQAFFETNGSALEALQKSKVVRRAEATTEKAGAATIGRAQDRLINDSVPNINLMQNFPL